jgi:hypothetical protein
MCTCSSQKDNEVVMNQNAIFINHVNLLNSAAKTGSSKKYYFFISWDFRVHLCINFWWGDMEIWGNAANGHAVSSSGAVVPCVAGTCAPAARLTWLHLAFMPVSGVARISTDGSFPAMRVQQRFVAPRSGIISIHIYYIWWQFRERSRSNLLLWPLRHRSCQRRRRCENLFAEDTSSQDAFKMLKTLWASAHQTQCHGNPKASMVATRSVWSIHPSLPRSRH